MAVRTSYNFPSNWRPISNMDYRVRNMVDKVDVFGAVYYLLGKNQLSTVLVKQIHEALIKTGIHPILSSIFFKMYFNVDTGDFKYVGNLKEFPQFVTTKPYDSFESEFKSVMKSSRVFNALFTDIIKRAGLTVESYKVEESLVAMYEAGGDRFDYKKIADEAEEVSKRLAKDWSNLREIWSDKFNIPLNSFNGIDGKYIKSIYERKIIKYLEHAKSIVSRMLAVYPRGCFNDVEDFYSVGNETLTKLTRDFYLSPSVWMSNYDSSSDNIITGPAILKGLKEKNPLNMEPSKNGGITLRVKAAVFDEMRRRDNLSAHYRAKVNELKKLVNDYIQKSGKEPPLDYLSAMMKTSMDNVKEYYRLMELKDVNLDDSIAADSRMMNAINIDTSRVDWENPEIIIMLIDELNKSWAIVNNLTNNTEKLIASLYIFEELDMLEVAEALNEKVEDVKEVYEMSMQKCRPYFRAKIFQGYR